MKTVNPTTSVVSGLAGLLLLLASASLFASSVPPEVQANGERLTGFWAEAPVPVAGFTGIPFAAPPVGPLRWRAPRPHSPRDGQQTAQDFAAACIQGDGMVDWYAGVARAFGHGPEVVGRPVGTSEDCLYLNVWSPRLTPDAHLPVMVFVHGGSNRGGWSYEPDYLGHMLAAQGVVVVTIAYRLGPFGFFSHRALNNGDGEPVANFALLDIRAAFQWVHQNIGVFGGDPENITGFGESAGAFDLVDLILADLDRGKVRQSLFSRLILQSTGGPPRSRRTLSEEQEIGDQLAGLLGLDSDVSAASLRSVPAADLLAAAVELPDQHYFSAVIDRMTLPDHPQDILRRLQAKDVDLITGTNADEWLMYIGAEATQKELTDWIAENAPQHQAALLEMLAGEQDPRRALDIIRTARRMMCPSRFLASRINEKGGRAWVYYFDRQRSGPGGQELGAYHGAELPYVFDRHDSWLTTAAEDRALTVTMMDYWVQFARDGDPNIREHPAWPVYTGKEPVVMALGDRVRPVRDPSIELCEMLGPGSWQQEKEQ